VYAYQPKRKGGGGFMKSRVIFLNSCSLASLTLIIGAFSVSCASTQIGSSNYIEKDLFVVTITTKGSDSDEKLAELAASAVGVNRPFAYGIAGRSTKSDLSQSL
jgi:hypothetical protein